MRGNWVNLNYDVDYETGKPIYAPVQIVGINKDGTVDVDFIYDKSESMQDHWDMKLVEPISLTEEILEKNGCKRLTWWKYHKDDIVTYLFEGVQVEIEERMINGETKKLFNLVDNCSDSGDYGYESNYLCDVSYVHKLQNALKVFEVEKEFIL